MKNKVLHLRITDEQHNKLIKIAELRRQTLSELVRTIIWLFTDRIKE